MVSGRASWVLLWYCFFIVPWVVRMMMRDQDRRTVRYGKWKVEYNQEDKAWYVVDTETGTRTYRHSEEYAHMSAKKLNEYDNFDVKEVLIGTQ